MDKRNNEGRKYIMNFNPDVTSLEQAHQDFSLELEKFNAGVGFENFNDFITVS